MYKCIMQEKTKTVTIITTVFIFPCIICLHVLIGYSNQLLKSLYTHTDYGVRNTVTCLTINCEG